jgi:hypothetical protein
VKPQARSVVDANISVSENKAIKKIGGMAGNKTNNKPGSSAAVSQRQKLNNPVTLNKDGGVQSPKKGNQSVPPPVKRSFLKRNSPAPPAPNVRQKSASKEFKVEKVGGKASHDDSFERLQSKGII